MAYGKPTLTLKTGDRVKVDLRRNGKPRDGVVIYVAPRIGALCAGSVEWMVRITEGAPREQWVSEACIEVAK